MSHPRVYQRIEHYLGLHLSAHIRRPTLKRVSRLVLGILQGVSALPAHIADSLDDLRVSAATTESFERQIRRMENDPAITVSACFYPLVQTLLSASPVQHLILILDPTTQKEHVVMVSVNAWYRGRALPLAWVTWPGNVPLEGARFWERIQGLLEQVATLLPQAVPVTLLADRAFGTPHFTDLVTAQGWDWIVRVQNQTLYRDRCGQQGSVASLVRLRGQRKKLRGWAFKKVGWREVSVLTYWGARHKKPLCLVSSLSPKWHLIDLYRKRFPIECTFRDYKSHGWRWEQIQVRDLEHLERLLIGMALATWLTVLLGAQKAAQLLAQPPSGKRHTRPWLGKKSLFSLGLWVWKKVNRHGNAPHWPMCLPDWEAPNWSAQIRAHHARAFVFA